MAYRRTRNIEASIIQYLQSEIDNDWNNITVQKTFSRVYDIPFNEKTKTACICVRVGTTAHDKVEIGSNLTKREPQILLDIFASSDGQRLDLKDYVVSKIKNGIVYYEYEIENGQIKTKTANGRITILSMEDAPLNFDSDKNTLDVHDRYRHLLTLVISINQVEA